MVVQQTHTDRPDKHPHEKNTGYKRERLAPMLGFLSILGCSEWKSRIDSSSKARWLRDHRQSPNRQTPYLSITYQKQPRDTITTMVSPIQQLLPWISRYNVKKVCQAFKSDFGITTSKVTLLSALKPTPNLGSAFFLVTLYHDTNSLRVD
jgi:hypothetical protein